MGLSIETLKRVCPKLEQIEEPACNMAELIWIRYLAYNVVEEKQVLVSDQLVGNTNVVARVITKLDGDRPHPTHPTRLVLRCEDESAFEGMILSGGVVPEPLRPFCLGARYDKMPKPYQSLKKAMTKVGLTHVDGANLDHLFDRLLLLNHLRNEIGDQFWVNLHTYTQYLDTRGDIRNVWLDD